MKAQLLIIILLVAGTFAVTSCASSKAGGGCKMNQGYVGYR